MSAFQNQPLWRHADLSESLAHMHRHSAATNVCLRSTPQSEALTAQPQPHEVCSTTLAVAQADGVDPAELDLSTIITATSRTRWERGMQLWYLKNRQPSLLTLHQTICLFKLLKTKALKGVYL